jgi:protein-tyrosine phosphatase
MFKILDNLATDGLDWDDGEPLTDDYERVDVRMLQEMDADNHLSIYQYLILDIEKLLLRGKKVCIQCSGGVSRSNAIAVGVLIDHFKMDYYDALALVEDKVPICQIEDNHIRALKKMFKVGLP